MNPEQLLYAGIISVAGVVVYLWNLVVTRNKICEAENAKMAERLRQLEGRVGRAEGRVFALTSMLRSCSVTGCVLTKMKLEIMEEESS